MLPTSPTNQIRGIKLKDGTVLIIDAAKSKPSHIPKHRAWTGTIHIPLDSIDMFITLPREGLLMLPTSPTA